MHLLVITGFLGSGKTTLLLRLADLVRCRDKKVAILVNEIGEIGIDNQLMRQLGFNVWELLGGCICCSLAGDVAGTLTRVHEEYKPDLVILEPTGAADPRNLMDLLTLDKFPFLTSMTRATLIDPLRIEMLMTVAAPLITATMKKTDMILINKADAANAEELAYARETARRHMPEEKIFMISAREELGADVTGALLPWNV